MDELIQDGQEKGMFDNLSGKGKPLNLQQNHYAGDMAFANDLLKEYDVPPAWIQERNGILNEMHALREEIVRQWAWHEREMGEASIEEKGRITIRWDDYCLKWIDQIAKLNKRIVTYNLKRPLVNMELFKLTIEDELARAQARRWLR
jgi:DnaJ family protein C protein 28